MRIKIFISCLFVFLGILGFSTVANAQDKAIEKREKELAKKKKEQVRKQQKAEEKGKKRHMKIQSKETRKRMKESKKRSREINEGKKEFFLKRLFSQKNDAHQYTVNQLFTVFKFFHPPLEYI